MKLNSETQNNFIIEENVYNYNLFFYRILKLLIQCGLSDNQLLLFQTLIEKNKEKYLDDYENLKKLLLESGTVVSENVGKYEEYSLLVGMIEEENIEMWIYMVDVAIELMLIKDLILQESKSYVLKEYKKEISEIKDKLSIAYDLSNLSLPYGQRVICSMITHVISSDLRNSDFILESSGATVKNFNYKIGVLLNKYTVNIGDMFQIIMSESINQSIKSDAGQGYESRVYETLYDVVDEINGHSHDQNITSVEYDFTFKISGKKCGISAKRTLRERYKQNFEDASLLSVDYMFLITLGTDLNKEKLNNILQKQGIFVIVADEIYESKDYLNGCNRVISSKNISRDLFTTILN